jgi:hypothetical protein
MPMFWGPGIQNGYTDVFRPVLMKVKDKVAIILPGWNSTDVLSIEETPNSMMSQVRGLNTTQTNHSLTIAMNIICQNNNRCHTRRLKMMLTTIKGCSFKICKGSENYL